MKNKRKTLYKNLKNITKKQKLQEKGITLIALVVTIIILLILAGVTLNIALSDNGLFSKAKEATDRYKQAQNEEAESIRQMSTKMYNEYVGAYVAYSPTNNSTGCILEKNITGMEDQTIKTDTKIKWRIWDFDGETLRLISDRPVRGVTLNGIVGYNYGIYAINKACKECYGVKDNEWIDVENLKRSDIQKVNSYDYTGYQHVDNSIDEYTNTSTESPSLTLTKFGQESKYEGNYKYPKIWELCDSKWKPNDDPNCISWEKVYSPGENNNFVEGNGTIFLKQSYYSHKFSNDKHEFTNPIYYDMLFLDYETNKEFESTYWLGGRTVYLESTKYGFGIQTLNAGSENNKTNWAALCFVDRFYF